MVRTGETAPDFIAPAAVGEAAQELELFRLVEDNAAVVLLFYPVDFVPAPTADLVAVAEAGWHDRDDVAVVGISADSLYAHTAYADGSASPSRWSRTGGGLSRTPTGSAVTSSIHTLTCLRVRQS